MPIVCICCSVRYQKPEGNPLASSDLEGTLENIAENERNRRMYLNYTEPGPACVTLDRAKFTTSVTGGDTRVKKKPVLQHATLPASRANYCPQCQTASSVIQINPATNETVR